MGDEWNNLPVCPHCGAEDNDWYGGLDADEAKSDGDQWEATCPSCEKDYTVVMSVSTEFCTMEIPDKAAEAARGEDRTP